MNLQKVMPFYTSRDPPREMKGRVYARYVRSSLINGSESMLLLTDVGLKFESRDADY